MGELQEKLCGADEKGKQRELGLKGELMPDIEKMLEYIEDNWELYGEAEIGMSKREASCYLGHPTNDMTREEIDEEVSEIQLAYYTEGEADEDEITAKYTEMKRLETPIR